MKKFISITMSLGIALIFLNGLQAEAPSTQTPSLTAIAILRSSRCPKTAVWVQATVREIVDTDTYIVADASGSILLFLPTEELEAIHLEEGTSILVYGKVDISPVKPEKNELYAEKIIPLQQ